MDQFLYRIQPTRSAMLVDGPTEKEAEIIGEHFTYLQELTDIGTVLMAGRTLNTDPSSFGIVVFQAESSEAAQKIVDDDPAVKQKVMEATLYPYRIALANMPKVS